MYEVVLWADMNAAPLFLNLLHEQANGSPYHPGSVETCCTVTWGAMGVEMLKMTGLSVVADELEMSLFNSGMLLESPSGRWCTRPLTSPPLFV